jgi:hypothetical protein
LLTVLALDESLHVPPELNALFQFRRSARVFTQAGSRAADRPLTSFELRMPIAWDSTRPGAARSGLTNIHFRATGDLRKGDICADSRVAGTSAIPTILRFSRGAAAMPVSACRELAQSTPRFSSDPRDANRAQVARRCAPLRRHGTKVQYRRLHWSYMVYRWRTAVDRDAFPPG